MIYFCIFFIHVHVSNAPDMFRHYPVVIQMYVDMQWHRKKIESGGARLIIRNLDEPKKKNFICKFKKNNVCCEKKKYRKIAYTYYNK